MTPRPSRYMRPAEPRRLLLQDRDRAILQAVAEYRTLISEHVQALVSPHTSLAVLRRRLRLLWSHELLDRRFVPFILDGGPTPPLARRPIYTLGARGGELLEVEVEPIAISTVEHNLIAIDWLTAVVAAGRQRRDVAVVAAQPEPALWTAVGDARARGPFIVPDAAVTIGVGNEIATFYLEVVRAGVRGGNQTLMAKLKKYADLHHRRFFREAYGHDRVRAVLVAASSLARAERLREMAADLPHGQQLFWFGTYAPPENVRALSGWTATTVFAPQWTDPAGQIHALIPGPIAAG